MEHQVHFTSSETSQTSKEYEFQWLILIFNRYTKEKAQLGRDWRLLILNGHNSHLNIRFLDWCTKHRILVYAYPLHLTHRLQPLDVSLFGPLAQYYSSELDNYIHKSFRRRGMSKRKFFKLFWPAFKRTFTEKNIKSGWARTEIQPYNESQVLNQVEVQQPKSRPSTAGLNSSAAISEARTREVRKLAYKVLNVSNPKARKFLNTIESIHTQNELLLHENQYLREVFSKEKKRRQRGKPLFK